MSSTNPPPSCTEADAAPTAAPAARWPHTPAWLPGGHAQTIWPALWSLRHDGQEPIWRRERWFTPDGDFIDADWIDPPAAPCDRSRPLVLLFHGLEGSSASHYAQAFAVRARQRGWSLVLPHFRGCSGELNWQARAYHSGDHAEIGWMIQQAAQRHRGPLVAVGVSLGGNALLRWAQEAGPQARRQLQALAAVCAPTDLTSSGHHLGRGVNRHVYTPMFLRTMKRKAQAKWQQHPGLFDLERTLRARNLYEFDDAFTAPLHGFDGTDDYWHRASARWHLQRLRLPTLLLNPLNDPFVPASSLPGPADCSACVTLWQPPSGGHVGFAAGRFPGHVHGLPQAVLDWLAPHCVPAHDCSR